MLKRILFRIFPLMLALVVMSSLRAQSNCDEIYLSAINRALNEGDCKDAQRFYEAYKACTEGRTNMAIERRIQECLNPPKKNGDVEIIKVGNVTLKMVYIEGGTFNMGAQKVSPNGDNYDTNARNWEKPVHSVTLDSYYIGETEVTQALWREVMGSEPTENGGWTTKYGRGDNYPAYYVSYEDVQEFIKRLNKRTGRTFRLPTEAEWEYAARGGNKSHGYKYSGGNNLDAVAWYENNSGNKSHPVKGKAPNELGLYDMTGNVYEWCQDWFSWYDSCVQYNPQEPSIDVCRVIRGGGWKSSRIWRVSSRYGPYPSSRDDDYGFRLVLEASK